MVANKIIRRSSRLSEGSNRRTLNYELSYEGKKNAKEILEGPQLTLKKILTVSRSPLSTWRNRFYLGDNLKVLRSLLHEPRIYKKVKLVYIDPPFATGSVFETRTGNRAYEDISFGADYLEFMRGRLLLLREIMHPEASIYLHLDAKMAFPVKVIMDEIFGPNNFRNFITRKKSNRKNFTRKQFGNISDYILFYTRTEDYTWHRPHLAWTQETAVEYQYVEPETGRRFMKVPIHAPGTRNGQTGQAWRGTMPPPGKHWQYPPRVLDELDANGEIYWSPNGNPRRKIYLEDSKGIPIQDIWLDCKDAHNQNIEVTGYPTEKPIEMLRRIIEASSNPGDIVLDCFAGSGTTIIAAEELQRAWVGIDCSLEAITTAITRLAKGSQPMGDFVKGKKPRNVSLFEPPSPLRTAFELHSDTDQEIPVELLQKWKELF